MHIIGSLNHSLFYSHRISFITGQSKRQMPKKKKRHVLKYYLVSLTWREWGKTWYITGMEQNVLVDDGVSLQVYIVPATDDKSMQHWQKNSDTWHRSTWKKISPTQLCQPQIPNDCSVIWATVMMVNCQHSHGTFSTSMDSLLLSSWRWIEKTVRVTFVPRHT